MNKILTRDAKPDDLASLLQFEQSLIDVERHFDKTITEESICYYDLKAILTSSDAHFVVAELDSKIIACGYAHILLAQHHLKYKKYALLNFMYVDPAHRGVGVNHRIIKKLEKWCHSMKITELRLYTYFENINAIKAYEKAGFSKHIIEMRKNI